MNPLHKILVLCIAVAGLPACTKTDDLNIPPPVALGGETIKKTAIDQWLYDSLTIPYNIDVEYRWDPFTQSNTFATLTPPDEENVIPAMSAIKRVWIDVFNAETGSEDFIKKYSPKQVKLVGSVEYQFGTVLLGQAEGGNHISFFDINQNFFSDNVTSTKDLIHTAHHEFAHNLNFLVKFPPEFKGISNQEGLRGYTGTWFNIALEDAREEGYITSYAMASEDEDFAEMVSLMLMEGRSRFNEIVASVNPTAGEALRRKEQFVVNYYKEVWNIDFYSLQTRVVNALYELIPEGAVSDDYGFEKSYTFASVNPDNPSFLPQSNGFKALFNQARDSVAAVPNLNLTLDSIGIVYVAEDAVVLAAFVHRDDATFVAQYVYNVSRSGDIYSYSFQEEDANGQVLHNAMLPLLDYFANNQFTVSWIAKPRNTIYPKIRFTPSTNPGNYFQALLIP